jgi:tetratricopeptide (TPR) repeat protein
MRIRTSLITLTALALSAGASVASMSGGSSPAPPSDPPPSAPQSQSYGMPVDQQAAAAAERRKQAEALYGNAYDYISKAKLDLESKKDKDAEKKFKKGVEAAEGAVKLDTRYYEAWNLIGFGYRKLGNYDKAIAAYTQSIGIKPDYAPAREYLGEAYLELGKLDRAKEQLVFLEHYNATDDANTLRASIASYVSAHPESATPDSSAAKQPTSSGL